MNKLINKIGLNSYDVEAPMTDIKANSKTVAIHLNQHIGHPATSVVKIGDKVFKGDLIGEIKENTLGSNIHSSVNGIIKDIRNNIIIIDWGM